MRLEDIEDYVPLPITLTEKGLKAMIEYSLEHFETLTDLAEKGRGVKNRQRTDVLDLDELRQAIGYVKENYGTDTFVYEDRLNQIRKVK